MFRINEATRPARDRAEITRRRALALLTAAFLVLAVTLATSGCGPAGDVTDTSGSSSTTTGPAAPSSTSSSTTTTSTTVAEQTTAVRVYYCHGEEIWPVGRLVPGVADVEAAAVKALLEGPTAAETQAGLSTAFREDTEFLGLTIADGLATVDLSAPFAEGALLELDLRLAQVVTTLTQFSTISRVNFKLDGKPLELIEGEGIILDHPLTRADCESVYPAIMIESPVSGDAVTSPVRVFGNSNTFEGTCLLEIVDASGNVLANEIVTATSGNGQRGTFDVTVTFTARQPGHGIVRAYEESAEDGSIINLVEVPVELK
jgi:germination protein M